MMVTYPSLHLIWLFATCRLLSMDSAVSYYIHITLI